MIRVPADRAASSRSAVWHWPVRWRTQRPFLLGTSEQTKGTRFAPEFDYFPQVGIAPVIRMGTRRYLPDHFRPHPLPHFEHDLASRLTAFGNVQGLQRLRQRKNTVDPGRNVSLSIRPAILANVAPLVPTFIMSAVIPRSRAFSCEALPR